jgi:hypothetical protein
MSEFELLNGDTLADLRALNESNLPHVATITVEQTSGAREGGSLVDETLDTLFEDEPCRLSPASTSRTAEQAAQPQTSASWILTFTAGTMVPDNAIAEVSGETNGEAWQRRVRIAGGRQTRAFSSMARYDAVDVSPADE